MIFFSWSSGGPAQGILPPLIFAVTILLQCGLGIYGLLPSAALSLWRGFRGMQEESGNTWEQEAIFDEGIGLWIFVVGIVVGAAIFVQQDGRNRWWPALRRNLFTGWRGPVRSNTTGGNAQPRRRTPRSPQERFADVAAAIQKLPVQSYLSPEDLKKLPAHQLKELMKEQGIAVRAGESLDKEDVVARIVAQRDSSCSMCSICYEDYQEGDVQRVLRCKHRFHVECIDRWFLRSADRSEAASCPLCNASLNSPG